MPRARPSRGSRRRHRRGVEAARATSAPKHSVARRRFNPSSSASIATRGSTCPSSAKNSPLRKRPARSGSSSPIAAASTRSHLRVRAAKRSISETSRGGATTRLPSRATPGARRAHQSIAPAPRATTDSGALSPSQYRASIPPASQDALPPSSALRSYKVTSAPRSTSSVAVARPTTPPPMTVARIAIPPPST